MASEQAGEGGGTLLGPAEEQSTSPVLAPHTLQSWSQMLGFVTPTQPHWGVLSPKQILWQN